MFLSALSAMVYGLAAAVLVLAAGIPAAAACCGLLAIVVEAPPVRTVVLYVIGVLVCLLSLPISACALGLFLAHSLTWSTLESTATVPFIRVARLLFEIVSLLALITTTVLVSKLAVLLLHKARRYLLVFR